MSIDFNKLREQHLDVFENAEVQAVAGWRQSNYDDATDEGEYLAEALENLKGLKAKIDSVVGGIKSE